MSDPMTIDTSTAAVTALLDGVTPGPWQAEWPESDGIDGEPRYVASTVMTESPDTAVCQLREDQEQDAAFIAAARELLPAVISERDELRGNIGAAVTRAEHAEGLIAAFLTPAPAVWTAFMETACRNVPFEGPWDDFDIAAGLRAAIAKIEEERNA